MAETAAVLLGAHNGTGVIMHAYVHSCPRSFSILQRRHPRFLLKTLAEIALLIEPGSWGKVLNAAFCVTGAFMFGDFFGYVGAVNASMLLPMIVAKLSSGIAAMIVALWMSKGK